MNTLNRVLVILGLIVVLTATTVILLVTAGVVRPETLALGAWWTAFLTLFQRVGPAARPWILAGGALLLLLGLLLLAWELRPASRRRSLLVRHDPLGTVTVAVTGVEELVRREAGRVPGAMEATSRVRQAPDGLHIAGRVSVAPDADVPALAQALQDRIKGAVERHVGRPVTAVHLDMQLGPLGEHRPRRGRRGSTGAA